MALALLAALAGCAARDNPRAESQPVSLLATGPAMTSAATYPAPQLPLDTTPITPVETVGAARFE